MNDAPILAKLGLSKVNTYYFQRRKHIFALPITIPNFPLAALGIFRSTDMFEERTLERYSRDEREKTLGKAALLLKEAKEKGNYSELVRLDPTDPRHPYYFEHPWQSALKMDTVSLTPYQQYLRWHCLTYRAMHEWDRQGLLYDDLMQPKALATDPFLEEAILRLPYNQRVERERRLSRAYDLALRREYLPDEDCIHPEDDVAYLHPYYHMVVDEHREQHENPVDVYSR
uniref:UQCRB n=1 Tax=Euglena gracilis TaxID=3039 RepID=UPI002FE4FAB4